MRQENSFKYRFAYWRKHHINNGTKMGRKRTILFFLFVLRCVIYLLFILLFLLIFSFQFSREIPEYQEHLVNLYRNTVLAYRNTDVGDLVSNDYNMQYYFVFNVQFIWVSCIVNVQMFQWNNSFAKQQWPKHDFW